MCVYIYIIYTVHIDSYSIEPYYPGPSELQALGGGSVLRPGFPLLLDLGNTVFFFFLGGGAQYNYIIKEPKTLS